MNFGRISDDVGDDKSVLLELPGRHLLVTAPRMGTPCGAWCSTPSEGLTHIHSSI